MRIFFVITLRNGALHCQPALDLPWVEFGHQTQCFRHSPINFGFPWSSLFLGRSELITEGLLRGHSLLLKPLTPTLDPMTSHFSGHFREAWVWLSYHSSSAVIHSSHTRNRDHVCCRRSQTPST